MLFETTDTVLKINNPRWLEITKVNSPTEPPIVNGGIPMSFGSHSRRIIDREATPIDPGTLPNPPRDDQAWSDFVEGLISVEEWRQRQEAFGGSSGFNFILDGTEGNKVFETSRDRYDRILASRGGDLNKMPSQYWLNEKSHSEPYYYEWNGVSSQNGGNWSNKDGGTVEIEISNESVIFVRALFGESREFQEFLVANGVDHNDFDMTVIGGKREDIHSLPTGEGRPQKPQTTIGWDGENKVEASKSFKPKA